MASFTAFPTVARAAGTYTSATANYSGANTTLTFQIVSPTWLTDDPSILVTIRIQQSFDSGVTWQEVTTFVTSPGAVSSKDGSLPQGGVVSNDARGARLVRGLLSLSAALTVGVQATVS